MAWIFSIVLAAVVAVLVIRIRIMASEIARMTEAASGGRALLVEQSGGVRQAHGLAGLQAALNKLVAENRRLSQTEKSYLDQISATLGSVREAVLIVNADNYVMLANEALQQMLRSPDSPLGRRLEGMIHGSEFYEYVRRVKGGGSADIFVSEVSIGGQSLWLEITGARLPAQEGTASMLTLFVLHDITKQKRLERVRTEFVANVSHELRTPVTIIKGFVDALIEDCADLRAEEQQRFLRKIQNNVARLHQMLEELLMLSRLESNPDAIRRERHPLGRVVAEAAENFQMRLDPDRQQLRVELTDAPDLVLLDRLRISQVIENLLENALRHAHGFTVLTVRTRVVPPNVICEVCDDGAGIPAKDLPHIFERFYRVDKGRSRESGGTGLGLSIVKHIVQQHGGEISAQSTLGKGTTIRMTIPFPEALAERAVLSFVRDRAQERQADKGHAS